MDSKIVPQSSQPLGNHAAPQGQPLAAQELLIAALVNQKVTNGQPLVIKDAFNTYNITVTGSGNTRTHHEANQSHHEANQSHHEANRSYSSRSTSVTRRQASSDPRRDTQLAFQLVFGFLLGSFFVSLIALGSQPEQPPAINYGSTQMMEGRGNE